MCAQRRLRSALASAQLTRVFAVRKKKAWILNYPLSTQQRAWSDWAHAQADLSLRWAHSHFVGFVMRRLKFCKKCIRPVWLESSLSARRKLGSLTTHWAHSEDPDQTGHIPRLIWVFAGHTNHFVGFVMRWLIFRAQAEAHIIGHNTKCRICIFSTFQEKQKTEFLLWEWFFCFKTLNRHTEYDKKWHPSMHSMFYALCNPPIWWIFSAVLAFCPNIY